MEEHIRGRAMSIDGWPIGENHHAAPRHAANHNVAIPRANQNAASQQEVAGARFVNFKSAALIEALGKHFRKTFGHVLDDND